MALGYDYWLFAVENLDVRTMTVTLYIFKSLTVNKNCESSNDYIKFCKFMLKKW